MGESMMGVEDAQNYVVGYSCLHVLMFTRLINLLSNCAISSKNVNKTHIVLPFHAYIHLLSIKLKKVRIFPSISKITLYDVWFECLEVCFIKDNL
jgi:hypothetical protein